MKVWVVAQAWGSPGCTGSDVVGVWSDKDAAEQWVKDGGGILGETFYITAWTLMPEKP